MSTKSTLGQFYTTNYEYILKDMVIPHHINKIVEPFAGNGDLIQFIKSQGDYEIECYDIDPKQDYITWRDTLNDPPLYSDLFVITNPPFLARNKSSCKEIYDRYNCNDLYKCFLTCLIEQGCMGGIVILPVNFFSSIRKMDVDLRRRFLERFRILRVNLFEEQVFDDTSCTVCSMQFERRNKTEDIGSDVCNMVVYPSCTNISMVLNENNNYSIGGELYNIPGSQFYKVERATHKTKNMENVTNINLKCIDDSPERRIELYIVPDGKRCIDLTVNCTARGYATLVITPKISKEHEYELVHRFNAYLNTKREKYNSMFLTNYRESKTISRKRISFELAFKICEMILDEIEAKSKNDIIIYNHHVE
jgi:hypothetical protein